MNRTGTGQEPYRNGIGLTAAESTPSWDPIPTPPADAPNVVVIVLDDTGFAHLGCYGSDIDTPNLDRLANGGLRYTNFHTTALCAPTRACLLTGRNHHSVGVRTAANVDSGFTNCRGVISDNAAIIPEVLGTHGYGTFALGKWHLTNIEDMSPAGPFGNWPLQRGFNRFYGFLGGATDQFSPELVVDNHPIDPPSEDGYHVSEDLVDQAMNMISAQQSVAPGSRFFTYLAFGATHAPHQAPQSYLDKYRGRYDKGWDVCRQEYFERQKSLGILPEGTDLSPRNPGVEAWEDLSGNQKALYARMQEAFAAFLDHTDDQIGRFIDYLEAQGLLDDTMIVFLSDNGASQEGRFDGTLNEMNFFNRMPESVDEMMDRIDTIGGPNNFNNYPVGWAQVGNTPLRFYKQNTYEGGIRDPLIIHWPNGIEEPGGIRDQYHHVTDIFPTILEAVGVEAPETYHGINQIPVEGTGINYTFTKAGEKAPTTKKSQYYEMVGHRGIWSDGWKAVTMHTMGTSFSEEKWALYHTDEDFSECHDLSEQEPEKLQQMKELWWAEAGRYNVLPLDDRLFELLFVKRPDYVLPNNRQRFMPGMPHLDRFKSPDIRNRSFEIIAKADLSEETDGVLVASGSRAGGITLFIQDGYLIFEYSYLGNPYQLRSATQLPNIACEFGVRYRKTEEHQGIASLLVRTEEGELLLGDMELKTMPYRQALYGMDVGKDAGPTVSAAYQGPNPFQGKLEWVEFSMKNDREDLKVAAEVEMENMFIEQ